MFPLEIRSDVADLDPFANCWRYHDLMIIQGEELRSGNRVSRAHSVPSQLIELGAEQ